MGAVYGERDMGIEFITGGGHKVLWSSGALHIGKQYNCKRNEQNTENRKESFFHK